eukprot:524654-Pleurochrysis_carterae.AAC.2
MPLSCFQDNFGTDRVFCCSYNVRVQMQIAPDHRSAHGRHYRLTAPPTRSHPVGAPSPRARASFQDHGCWYRRPIVISRPLPNGRCK